MASSNIDFVEAYEMESTIQLKKILRIGVDEQNKDEDSRPTTSSNAIATTYQCIYKERRSSSPSSSSVSSSSTCSSDLSSLASSSTGSYFFGPRQRKLVFPQRRCRSTFDLNSTSSSYSNDHDLLPFYDDCEVGRTQEWRELSFSSSSSEELLLLCYYEQQPSYTAVQRQHYTTHHTEPLSIPTSVESSESEPQDDPQINNGSLLGLRAKMCYIVAPSPNALPKPPAHWLTGRALGEPREPTNNLFEMLRRSSAMQQQAAEVDSTAVDHNCDLDLVSQNLKMLLKVD